MRHPRSSHLTALGAAMLLLVSCGSPAAEQDSAPAEDSTSDQASQPTADSTADPSPQESEDAPSSEESPQETQQPEDTATPDSAAPSEEQDDDAGAADFSTEAQESEGFPGEFTTGDEPSYLVDVRSGVHDGFDRVVFEFAGDVVPSWRGEYTESAAELGRGEPIDVAGGNILEINVNGPSWMLGDEPTDQLPTQEYYERDRGGAFEEIFVQGPFEAHSQYLIGMEEELPFQVRLLEEPTRLVVDLATEQ